MIDIKTDIPLREDCLKAIQDIHAQIRDLLIEEEQLLRAAVGDEVLMTADEVAAYFRTDNKHIPSGIPKIRCGNRSLYPKKEVQNFIKLKMRKY